MSRIEKCKKWRKEHKKDLIRVGVELGVAVAIGGIIDIWRSKHWVFDRTPGNNYALLMDTKNKEKRDALLDFANLGHGKQYDSNIFISECFDDIKVEANFKEVLDHFAELGCTDYAFVLKGLQKIEE